MFQSHSLTFSPTVRVTDLWILTPKKHRSVFSRQVINPSSRKDTVMARTASIGNLSVAALQAEISRRQRSVSKLVRQRNKLISKLNRLDAAIRSAGGDVGGRGVSVSGRRRPKNKMNLADALHALLKGKTLSVTEASAKVQEAGYKTTSPKNFRTIVNQTLINHGTMFKRVGRGQYTSK